MPKRTVTTIINAKFDVSTGEADVDGESVDVRILHVVDGVDRIDVIMPTEAAVALADRLRADGIVVPKIVAIPGTKGVKP